MAWLSAAAPYITAGAGAVSAISAIQEGNRLKAARDLEVRQLEADALAEAATAQRAAETERKRARLLQSRVRALSAASGAGAFDPTIVDIMSDIQQEGELRALNALYEGGTAAQGLEFSANIRRREGREARRAGSIRAVDRLFSTTGSIATRYG